MGIIMNVETCRENGINVGAVEVSHHPSPALSLAKWVSVCLQRYMQLKYLGQVNLSLNIQP